jgi:hypothetical protein
MKRVLSFAITLFILICCVGCNTNTEQSGDQNLDLVNKPSEAYVIECLKATPNIVNVAAVTKDNDPNGKLNTEGGYYSAIFFSTDFLDDKDLSGDDLIDEGTDAGGCIELYCSEEEATDRNDYLAKFDDSWLFNAGYHTTLGTIVIRTSQHLNEDDQETLENNIIAVLTGGEIKEPEVTVPTPTEKPSAPDANKPQEPENTQITVTMSEEELKYLPTAEAETKLRNMGFSIFQYETLDAGSNRDLDGKIGAVEIKSWTLGNGDFSKGDKYDTDAIIVLWTYKYSEPEKPSPVYYSTNDYETAKNGNTGVFSYKNKSGSYDIYWIIDFNEGFVYWFTEGNGENVCDKVKIVSGDLNNKVTVTWYDGSDQWSWYLHFKYMNHPETLIVNDHNGFATEFAPTNLDDALQIRNTKSIKEYLAETDQNAKALAAAIEYRDSNPDIILSIYDLWNYLEGLGYDDEAISYAMDNAEGFDVGAAMYDYEKITMFHNQGRSRTAIINYYLDILSYEEAKYLVDECLAGRKLTYEWTEYGLILVEHTAGDNPTDAPKEFRITWSAQLIDSNHVGDNWSKSFEVNDTAFSSGHTITLEPDSQFTIRLSIQENDANPDTGYYFERITYSEELCTNGYSISETLYVRENGGRYSGNRAEWIITITVTPI